MAVVASRVVLPLPQRTSDAAAGLLGWHVFVASLFVLVLLKRLGASTPGAHLNIRIFVLGVCIGGFVLYPLCSLKSYW